MIDKGCYSSRKVVPSLFLIVLFNWMFSLLNCNDKKFLTRWTISLSLKEVWSQKGYMSGGGIQYSYVLCRKMASKLSYLQQALMVTLHCTFLLPLKPLLPKMVLTTNELGPKLVWAHCLMIYMYVLQIITVLAHYNCHHLQNLWNKPIKNVSCVKVLLIIATLF